MRITSSGNVGIGTDSPDKLLHIERNDTSTSASFKIKNSGTGDATVQLGTSTTNVVFGVDNSDGDKFKLGFGSALQSAGDLTLDSNGNVGIGTSSPDSNAGLEVYGKRLYVDAADNYALRLEKSSVVGGYIGAPALSNLAFYSSGGSERMRITSSGSLLVGATAQIGTGSHLIKAIGDTLALDVYTSTSTAGRDVFAVRSDIGGTETKVGVIEANGDFQSATNSYGSISDQSVKQDIVDANSQMEDVKNIRLRNYRLIDHVTAYGDDAKVHLGVVAQELEAENMNGLVSENADGVKGVRYSVMLLKALGALQETITMVEDLQAENTQIKARLTALEG